MSTTGLLLRRAQDIFQTGGWTTLIRHTLDFVRPWFFQYENCYLYEHTLRERNEAEFMPRIGDFTLKIVSTNEEAYELAATTGFDFRRRFIDARRMLDKGAIAFCILVKGELAHIGWVGMTEEAKKSMGQLPYKVDFSNGEACTGGMWTDSRYRGMGLAIYGYFRRCQFLREKGKTVARNAVATNNVAAQKLFAKFGSKRYARGRYLKVLWWQSWKEKPLNEA